MTRLEELKAKRTSQNVNNVQVSSGISRLDQLRASKGTNITQSLPKAKINLPGISNTAPTIQEMAKNLNVQEKDGILRSTGKILNHGASNAVDATVDTIEFGKNAFKYQMREDERKASKQILSREADIEKLTKQLNAIKDKGLTESDINRIKNGDTDEALLTKVRESYKPTMNLPDYTVTKQVIGGNINYNVDANLRDKLIQQKGIEAIPIIDKIFEKQGEIDYLKKQYNIKDAQKKLDEVNKFAFEPNVIEQATENYVQKTAEDLSKSNKATQYIGNAVGSVGRMVPSIASNAVLPGSGLVPMYANASQSSFEEALQNGADYEQAIQNGVLSGALEVGTEMASGGLSNTLTGIPSLAKVGKLTKGINNKFIKGAVNLAGEITGEGLEEVASTIVQPYIDRLTYNPEAENATAADMWVSFRDSILPTILMQGGGVAAQSNSINKYYNQQINEVKKSNLNDAQKTQLINELNNQKKVAIQQIITGDEETQNNIQNVSENQEIVPKNENISQNNAQFSLNNGISAVRQSANNLQKQGLTIPESTVSTFENIQNKRQGLNIEFDTTVQGNGVYTVNEDGTRTIKINPNSPRALEFTLVHELGHDLKVGDANTYQELQNYILDYAKTKEGYEVARQALGETYMNQLGEGNFVLNDEAANDILGQAIGNQQFLNSLAQSKPNVFQKIWNWVRNVLFDGNNTGKGFADRKFLNDMQNKFRTAYNQAFNNQTDNDNKTQHSIQEYEGIGRVAQYDGKDFMVNKNKNIPSNLKLYFDKNFRGKEINNKKLDQGRKYARPGYGQDFYNEVKAPSVTILDDILNTANSFKHESDRGTTKDGTKKKHMNLDTTGGFNHYPVKIGIPLDTGEIEIYIADAITRIDKNNREYFYDLDKIKEAGQRVVGENPKLITDSSASNNSIPSNNNVVNNQSMQNNQNNTQNSQKSSFSLSENSTDNQGRQLSKGQQEYFKNSKVVDDNGNLKEVYHGTPYDFNTFNYDKLGENTSSLGAGFYFTDVQQTGEEYTRGEGQLKKVYLNIKKPMSYGKTTMTKEEYRKFISAVNQETNGNYLIDYDGIDNAMMEYDYGGDDIDLVNAVHNASGLTWEKTYDVLRKSTGFDGIISQKDFLNKGETVYVAFNPDQIKNVDNTNPTDNPDIRYSQSNNQWQKFLNDNFNLMPNANRSIAEKMQNQIADDTEALTLGKTKKIKTPAEIANMTEKDIKQEKGITYKHKTDKHTPYQRKFFENMESSKIISGDVKDRVDMTSYEKKANETTLEKVNEKLNENGDKMIKEWERKTKNFTDEDVALGAILIQRYQQQGDIESAVDVVQKLADMGTEAGRAVQMFSIFQRLTPEAMMVYQQRKLDAVFDRIKQKKTGEWVKQNEDKFNLTAEDAKFIQEQVEKASNAETERQKQIELAKIEKRINDKLPPEAGQSIKALRRIAMLFNPKTQVRNIVGNTLIKPVNMVADVIGTQIDKAIAKKTGVRTTNYTNLKSEAQGFKKGIKESIEDYKLGIRTEPTGSKYEFEIGGKPFNENTKSEAVNAVNRKLNGVNNLLSAVMSGGDRPFYEAAFNNSLQGQMKANNVDVPTSDMIDIATNEALQRTWNDNNSYTQAVLGIRSAMNKLNIKGFGLGDLIIPFAKTPANLTKAMVEYSPAGFVESLIDFNDMRKAISRGEMTPQQQKKFVSSTSKAIAGTILYAIAGSLVKGGAVTGSKDKDKDVANFEQNVLGIQPYSIKIGDKTYTYSWANPINFPLAVMADTYKMSKENAKLSEILYNAFKVGGDTLLDNSFLQGIKELFEADSLADGLVNAVADMPNQFVPTFMKQIADLADDTKRQSFEYGDLQQTTINKAKAKIPGVKNELAPQVNTFGEEIKNYGGDNNPFNIFFNPANISKSNATESQKALYDLYQETKDKTIFPRQAPYYVSNNGEKIKLSSQDRAEYQKISGEYVTKELDALFDSDFYKTLSNNQKVDVVNKIVSDADTKGKDKWVDSESTEKLVKLEEELDGIPMVDYYNAWIAQKGIESDKNYQGKTITNSKSKKQKEAVDKAVGDLTKEQKERLYGIFNISEKVW